MKPTLPILVAGFAMAMNACVETSIPSRQEAAPVARSGNKAAPTEPLGRAASLDDLVRYALAENPGIDAAEAKVRRLMAKVPQAASLPDPKLKLSAGSLAETAAGRVDWIAGVEQALPFPGKLRALAKAVGRDAEAAAASLQAVRLDIAARVRQAYWSYYQAAQTTAITTENQQVLTLVRESIDARVAANRGSQDDQLRLATEAGRLEQALIVARRDEARARARLNALLDRPTGSTLPRPAFHTKRQQRDLKTLLATAEAAHPEVKAAEAQLNAFRHRLKLAELDRYPNFTLGLAHAAVSESGLAPSANGRDQFLATIGITLPLWQAPRRARVEEARAGIDESTAKIGAARASLRGEVEDAWLRAKSSEQLIALFDKQILPESKQAFEGTLNTYAAGGGSFVDALDSWRQLLTFQLQQAGNKAQLGMALAALRRATGTPD